MASEYRTRKTIVDQYTTRTVEPDEVFTAARCAECDHLEEELSDDPLYECGNCGSTFTKSTSEYDSHRCECGKFASKLDPNGCPECGGGAQEEVPALKCPDCDNLVEMSSDEVGATGECDSCDIRFVIVLPAD